MAWSKSILQLHHELDALTRAAMEADPAPADELVVAGWRGLRELTQMVVAGRFHRLKASLERSFEHELFLELLSWPSVLLPDESPPCSVLDKQWDARSRLLLARLREDPGELGPAVGLACPLEVQLKHCGLTNTWRLLEVEGMRRCPPLVVPAYQRPGVRSRVSALALGF